VTDDVFLDENMTTGVKDFEFYLGMRATGVESFSGILGLSRDIEYLTYNDNGRLVTESAGPLYYHYLHDEGTIKNSTFSLLLGKTDEDSYIHFGDEDFVN
jgi:hypothetical protein